MRAGLVAVSMIDALTERAYGLCIRLNAFDEACAELKERAKRAERGLVVAVSLELRCGEDGDEEADEDEDEDEVDAIDAEFSVLLGRIVMLCGREDLMVILCGRSSMTTLGRDVS